MQTLCELIPRFRALGRREAIRQCTPYASRVVSYDELHGLIGTCSSFLQAQGLNSGDRLLLQAENSPEWVALFWACVARGIVVVPIDMNFSQELSSRIRNDCSARFTADSSVLEILRERGRAAPSHDFQTAAVTPDDVVEIIYSSGTTGEPHGVVHRHRNICANLAPFQREIAKYRNWAMPFQPIRILELLPLSHMFGQSMGLFVPVFLEGSVVFTGEIRAAALAGLVHDNRVSVMVCVPRFLDTLHNEISRRFPDVLHPSTQRLRGAAGFFSRWWKYRHVHSRFGWKFWAFVAGGARIDPEHEQFWSRLGFAVIQGYGLTEASPVVAVNHPFSSRHGSLGKPVPGQEVRIAPDGEILVRGESVAGAVDAEGWLHTGDLGEMDSEGRLYFRGRLKDVIVTPEGLNVSPEDVEAEIRRVPQIKDCAVVGIGEHVHAALILRRPETPSPEIEQSIQKVNQRLEAHQRIRHWSIWPSTDFPRTASTLKVKRAAVASQIAAASPAEFAAPDPSAMSSLERVEFLTELEERHGIEIDEAAFSLARTADELKRFIANPAEARRQAALSLWPLTLPVRLLRNAFQRVVPVPLFRNRLPLTVTGVENLANLDGPVIFAANHASDLDVPAIFAALPPAWRKHAAPAIRADYFGTTWKLRLELLLARGLYNGFPLPQEVAGTRRAIEYAGELLRRGYCPLIFPEGRRTRDGALQRFRPGVGMMGIRLQVPVVPIHIKGMYAIYSLHDSWPKTGPVRVSFGAPIRFSASTGFEAAAQAIRDAIEKMSD